MSSATELESLVGREPHLEAVLAAWHDATVRLEQTHSALRTQVTRLTDELEIKNRELARENRLADLGRMASHVAHEVRNNLVPVALYLSLLRRRISEDRGSLDILDKVDSGVRALDATVHDLLSFTAERDPKLGRVNLRILVEDVVDALAPQLEAQGIDVDVDVPSGLAARADHDMLRRAVLNLALNALDAMPDGGELTITGVDGLYGCELEIADSGPGLSGRGAAPRV
jgi:signal transduction histidine kinase